MYADYTHKVFVSFINFSTWNLSNSWLTLCILRMRRKCRSKYCALH